MSLPIEQSLAVARQLAEEANALAQKNPALSDAKWRAAISRAYYAAFWAARHHWQTTEPNQPLFADGRDHGEVEYRFWRRGDDKSLEISANLELLKDLRHGADYDEVVSDLRRHSAIAILLAERILNGISTLDG